MASGKAVIARIFTGEEGRSRNVHNHVLYTGVTNNLPRKVYEHRAKLVEGFTKKYNITKLEYYEACDPPESVILREKQIKGGSRQKKIDLINSKNTQNGAIFTMKLYNIASHTSLAMTDAIPSLRGG